jgi:hypothetical protein
MPSVQPPYRYDYDFALGIDAEILAYIRESAVVESRISPVPCYLLFQAPTGSIQGSVASPMTIVQYSQAVPQARAVIWPSGSFPHPDTRPYTNYGNGSIFTFIDSVQATRVINVEDLVNNNEFAVVERLDLTSKQIELVFNPGFNPTGHVVTYYYSTMAPGVNIEELKRGDGDNMSLFGWSQYRDLTLPTNDPFQKTGQVLVRQPIAIRDLIVNEEGKVTLDERQCWMIWTPYVHDFDVLIVAPEDSISGTEERYELVNKQDSIIQRVLMTQRFKVHLLEKSDPRYQIPYIAG